MGYTKRMEFSEMAGTGVAMLCISAFRFLIRILNTLDIALSERCLFKGWNASFLLLCSQHDLQPSTFLKSK